jgi:hypothetical protein
MAYLGMLRSVLSAAPLARATFAVDAIMPARRRPCARAILGLAITLAAPGPLAAAELLVFERPGCPYCAAFDREVAPIYPLTTEGKAIPARRVDITRPIPADFHYVKVERLTPVFVLVDNGREIGRFRGYGGDDHFWGLLGVLVARLDDKATPAAGKDSRTNAGVRSGARVEH